MAPFGRIRAKPPQAARSRYSGKGRCTIIGPLDTIIINGGTRLSGTVSTGGAKNAALPLLFAAAVFVLANLMVDIAYGLLNPRIRVS